MKVIKKIGKNFSVGGSFLEYKNAINYIYIQDKLDFFKIRIFC